MSGLRLIGRGLRDTYDSLFSFVIASLLWWCSALPAFVLWPAIGWFALLGALPLMPGATVALFAAADPRRAIGRPGTAELVVTARDRFGFGLRLALATVPIPLILVNNILVFGGSGNWLASFLSLWVVLLVVSSFVFVLAFAVAGMFDDDSVRTTLRRAVFVLVVAPFRGIFVLAVLVAFVLIGRIIVVPLILFVPALVAATLDRHVARAFALEIVDPNAPTDERMRERTSGKTEPGWGSLWRRGR